MDETNIEATTSIRGEYNLWTKKRYDSGIPVVLCNGGPGCCDYLEPVADLIEEAQLIHFEHRGCGRSDLADRYSIQSSLEDLEAIRKHYGFDEWIVLGHSWGADLALFYALEYPQHCKGVICLAGGRIHNDRDWSTEYRKGRDAGLEAELEYAYPYNIEVNKQVNQSWKDYIKQPDLLVRLSKLEKPALFIYGRKDIRPSWPIEQVAALLPYGDLQFLDHADHHVWLGDADSRTLLQYHLNRFLGSIAQS